MAVIGIMGGTFNPIHVGHIKIAQAALLQYNLDEVWFMPNHIPGYKSGINLVSGNERLEMVKLAIADIPYFKSSDYELKRSGNTYTSETLTLLCKEHPKDSFYFIIGEDSLDSFDKWKNPEIILQYAKILAAPRDGQTPNNINERILRLDTLYNGEYFYLIQCENIPCSSSEIRHHLSKLYQTDTTELLCHAEEIASMLYLPTSVYKYIINHTLYK